MRLPNCKGFTIVEVVIVSALLLVVGGALTTAFLLYINESSKSIASFVVQQDYENVSKQISRDVRKASFVLKENETPTYHGHIEDTVSTIVLWDASSNSFAKYKIEGNKLLEGMEMISYNAGGNELKINEASSFFIINSLRKGVKIELSISKELKNNSMFTMSSHSDIYVCRN